MPVILFVNMSLKYMGVFQDYVSCLTSSSVDALVLTLSLQNRNNLATAFRLWPTNFIPQTWILSIFHIIVELPLDELCPDSPTPSKKCKSGISSMLKYYSFNIPCFVLK